METELRDSRPIEEEFFNVLQEPMLYEKLSDDDGISTAPERCCLYHARTEYFWKGQVATGD
jgi:hypothetical protein